MSAVKYGIIGVCLISGIVGVSSYYNLGKIEESMQKDVQEWNTHLPEGFAIRLNKSIGFTGASGSYILSHDTEGKKVDIFTLNFESAFNITNLVFPTSKLPIKGTGILALENLNTDEIQYSIVNGNKEFLTFNGFMGKQGNFEIKYQQPAYLLGIASQNEDYSNQVYLKVADSSGQFIKNGKNVDVSSIISQVDMLDTPEQKDGITFKGVNTNLKFTDSNNTTNTIFSSNIDNISDASPESLFVLNGIKTTLEINENNKDFTHKVKIDIKSANTSEQKDVSMKIDYDMTVPLESKSAILSILNSQESDYEKKQENAFKLFNSGFHFNLKQFQVNQGKEYGNIVFDLNIKPKTNNELLSERTSLSGLLDFFGSTVPMVQMVIPLPLEDINSESLAEQKLKFEFNYKDNNLLINKKRAEKNTEDAFIKSLVGLDMLMKEAEDNLNAEKNVETKAENSSVEEELEEIPGTEDNSKTSS